MVIDQITENIALSGSAAETSKGALQPDRATTPATASRPEVEISTTAQYLSSTMKTVLNEAVSDNRHIDGIHSLTATCEAICEPKAIAQKIVQLETLFFKQS